MKSIPMIVTALLFSDVARADGELVQSPLALFKAELSITVTASNAPLEPTLAAFLPPEMRTGEIAQTISDFLEIEKAAAARARPDILCRAQEKFQIALGTNCGREFLRARKAVSLLPALRDTGMPEERRHAAALALVRVSEENHAKFARRYAEHLNKVQGVFKERGLPKADWGRAGEAVASLRRVSSTSVVMALALRGIQTPDEKLVSDIVALGAVSRNAAERAKTYAPILEAEGISPSFAQRFAFILEGPFDSE